MDQEVFIIKKVARLIKKKEQAKQRTSKKNQKAS